MKLIDRIANRQAFSAFGPPPGAGAKPSNVGNGGGLSGSGTPVAGRLAFWAGESVLGHEDGLTYDAPTQTLSVGRLDVGGVTLDSGNQLSAPEADRLIGWADSVNSTAYFAPSAGIEIVGPELRLTESQRLRTIDFVLDGNGSAISVGAKGARQVPFAGVIKAARLLADKSGSITVDIRKDSYASYSPGAGASITGATPPKITSGVKSEDTGLDGWMTKIASGDILSCHVTNASAVTRATLVLIVEVS